MGRPHKYSLEERKRKHRQIYDLLALGHTTSSAAKIVGYHQSQVSIISRKPWFQRKLAAAQEQITGRVKAALVQRATGMKLKKEYQSIDKTGEVRDLTEVTEVAGDVKAQLAWLSAKDKEGNWDNGKSGIHIQVNNALQNVSTEDLLLTLKSAAKELKPGGEGALVSGEKEVEVVVTPKDPYNPDYDPYHATIKKNRLSSDYFHDPKNVYGESSPTEGEFENLGEDEESSDEGT